MAKKQIVIDPDPDVIRSAWIMIRNHGERAMREATRQQQAMIKRGDTRGISLWWSIGQAIQELRHGFASVRADDAARPAGGERD